MGIETPILEDVVASRLVSALQALGYAVTLGTATEPLPNLARLKIRAVQDLVCRACNVNLARLTCPRRSGSLVRIRHMAMWLARECTDAGYTEIGRAFNRDHTSVIHGVRAFTQRWRVADPDLGELADELRAALLKMKAGDA